MVDDEPALWNSILESKRARVMAACKAMCRSNDTGVDIIEEQDNCATPGRECDTPAGGSCIAFGLYGHMGIAVVDALDNMETPNASR
jgi:hypothetical protein